MWLNFRKKLLQEQGLFIELWFFFFFFQQQSMVKWAGWLPHPQILDLQSRTFVVCDTPHSLPTPQGDVLFTFSSWSGRYELMPPLLMAPKRKANGRWSSSCVTELKKKKKIFFKEGKNIHRGIFFLSLSLKNVKESISTWRWRGDRNGSRTSLKSWWERRDCPQKAFEQDYGKKEQ